MIPTEQCIFLGKRILWIEMKTLTKPCSRICAVQPREICQFLFIIYWSLPAFFCYLWSMLHVAHFIGQSAAPSYHDQKICQDNRYSVPNSMIYIRYCGFGMGALRFRTRKWSKNGWLYSKWAAHFPRIYHALAELFVSFVLRSVFEWVGMVSSLFVLY